MQLQNPVDDGDLLTLQAKDSNIAGGNGRLAHRQEENVPPRKGRIHALSTAEKSCPGTIWEAGSTTGRRLPGFHCW